MQIEVKKWRNQMSVKYAYVEAKPLGSGEIVVCGKTSSGRLLFGFKALCDPFNSWRETARNYTPTGYIPVFQPNRPARLDDGAVKIFRARC
jgi:hypothetical protein